jgi:hypothetical protein
MRESAFDLVEVEAGVARIPALVGKLPPLAVAVREMSPRHILSHIKYRIAGFTIGTKAAQKKFLGANAGNIYRVNAPDGVSSLVVKVARHRELKPTVFQLCERSVIT